jgi:hypothetical protein
MTLAEIEEIQKEEYLPVSIDVVSMSGICVCIDNFVAIKVIKVNKSYDRSNVFDLYFGGRVEGYLFFTCHKKKIDISSMSKFEFVAFLSEANFEDYSYETYEFKYDYVLLKEPFREYYELNYKSTAPLWGGFSHDLKYLEPDSKIISTLVQIEASNELKELDQYSYESCVRALEQEYAFERYLKLYHLLELQFDYYVIAEIQNLTIPADNNKIGKLLKNYSRSSSEVDRLTEIIDKCCSDVGSLELMLNKVFGYRAIAEEIFVNYGNSGKPLSEISKFTTVFDAGSFRKSDLASKKIVKADKYDEFIRKLVAYWIYRVRCSVAHNKIGEYILAWPEEEFMVEFAEPLLKEVLMQMFKK